jgi:hypothetical protein
VDPAPRVTVVRLSETRKPVSLLELSLQVTWMVLELVAVAVMFDGTAGMVTVIVAALYV